jgi:hypothetical protein
LTLLRFAFALGPLLLAVAALLPHVATLGFTRLLALAP